jgi:hypothetical protein
MPSTEQNTSVTAPVGQRAVKAVAKKVARPVAKHVARPAPRKATASRRPAKAEPSEPVQAVPAVTVAAPPEARSGKLLKAKKSKLVHEDFTLPMLEYLMLETLKLRSSKLGSPVKKNVLVRAGIKALAAMSDGSFLAALKTVPSIKPGRSPKD